MTAKSGWSPGDATSVSDGNPDTAIVPYVEALNAAGVVTYQSCSGHVHEDGRKSDGHLWFESDEFDPQAFVDAGDLHTAARQWGREAFPVWIVHFPGLAISERSLRLSMDALFTNLGVGLP